MVSPSSPARRAAALLAAAIALAPALACAINAFPAKD